MDEIENKIAPQPESAELQAQVDSLQHLVVTMLVLLIVVSGTLWIYLRWQVKYTRTELEDPRASMYIAEYNKSTGPATDEFIKRLVEFGRTHPDFTPIMTKYGIKAPNATNAPPAALTPASKK